MSTADTQLGTVWAWIRSHADKGVQCPACGQRVQVYWRSINAGMAYSAVKLYRIHQASPWRWVHLPSEIGRRSAEEAKLAYWGLVEVSGEKREDGGKASQWRITQKGADWVTGAIAVPKYVRVFDGEPWGPPIPYSRSGRQMPDVTIRMALGDKFDYDALMSGEP